MTRGTYVRISIRGRSIVARLIAHCRGRTYVTHAHMLRVRLPPSGVRRSGVGQCSREATVAATAVHMGHAQAVRTHVSLERVSRVLGPARYGMSWPAAGRRRSCLHACVRSVQATTLHGRSKAKARRNSKEVRDAVGHLRKSEPSRCRRAELVQGSQRRAASSSPPLARHRGFRLSGGPPGSFR